MQKRALLVSLREYFSPYDEITANAEILSTGSFPLSCILRSALRALTGSAPLKAIPISVFGPRNPMYLGFPFTLVGWGHPRERP